MSKFKTRKLNAEMNVVPYVDVMLVLLVIFMATAPLIMQGVDVELPSAKAKLIDQKSEPPMIVSVDQRGLYYLNISEKPQTPIELEHLLVRVAAELQRTPKRPVLVKGDKRVDYGKVVAAMGYLQQAGAGTVGLMTEDS
jgi:biopolymer transport protein TolR